MTQSILEEAQGIIWGDREQTYGAPSANLQRIAMLWTAYIASKEPFADRPVTFTPEDVCWMMVMLKTARQINASKRDNLVDAAGYIGLIERL